MGVCTDYSWSCLSGFLSSLGREVSQLNGKKAACLPRLSALSPGVSRPLLSNRNLFQAPRLASVCSAGSQILAFQDHHFQPLAQ